MPVRQNLEKAETVKIKSIAALVIGAACAGSVCAEIVEDIKGNVRDNWRKVAEHCQQIQKLDAELPNLPDKAWFSTDKQDQLEKIRGYQQRIREELLSVDTRKILEKAEKLAKKIASKKQEIVELKEERGFAPPEKQKKFDASIQKKQEELQRLTAEHAAELEKVKKELDAIGLHAKGGNLNVLLAMADRADIIDTVIVAKGIGEILGSLREVLKDGDALSAKRYYGVYVALVDVHIFCYEQYLAKSRYGEWRSGLARIETNAVAAVEAANTAIASGDFSAAQCDIFRKTIANNNTLMTGVKLYRKLLDAHETAIERKLPEARKRRTVAKNLYDTISGMVDFGNILQSSQDDFSAVMELELPDIAILDDSATEAQLDAISKMLDMN